MFSSLRIPLALTAFQLFATCVVAQTSNAVCLPYYQWAFNSHKQSPCEVASSLIAVCNDGPYVVKALPEQSQYLGPKLSDATPCMCSTVTYSLLSACGACQAETYLSWSTWAANCGQVFITTYPQPIPSGTLVPGWAYQNVTAGDTFNQTLARLNANSTESTAIPSPTKSVSTASTTSSVTLTSVTAATSTQSSSSNSSTTQSQSHANAIGAGAIAAFIGGSALLAGVLYFFYRRSRRHSTTSVEILPSLPTERTAELQPPMSQYRQNTSPVSEDSRSALYSREAYTNSTNSNFQSAHPIGQSNV